MVDAIRSCARGLGPSVQAQPLPLHALYHLPGDRHSWAGGGGPACPRSAVVVGAWWLMREVELATARACHLSLHNGVASLLLPASKTDTQAVGVSGSHRCGCGHGLASPGCPYHAAWGQLLWLKRMLPAQFDPTFSVCGWESGDSEHAVAPPGALGPVGHWDLCGLCDPEHRLTLAAAERAQWDA